MRIGDLVDGGHAEIRTGPFGTQLRASDYVAQGRAVLNVRNVGLGDVRTEGLEYVNEATASRLRVHLLLEGDIVFGRKGAVERHAYIDAGFAGAMQGSDCIRLRIHPDGPLNSRFLSYALRTQQHQAWMKRHCSHGATMASLNQDILRLIDIPPLPRASQDRVAEVLSAFDDLVAHNARRISILNALATALYREWFVHFRIPEHPISGRELPSNGGLPLGWERRELRSLASVNPASANPAGWQQVRYLDISAVGERLLAWPAPTPGQEAPGRARRLVADGDIVHAMVRPNRRSHALVVDPPADSIVSTGLAVIRPRGDETAYLFEVISSQEFTDYLVGRATGAAYPAVKPADFEGAPVVVPPSEVLARFDAAVGPLHRLAASLAASCETLGRTRDLLVPKLVTGQIDVDSLGVDDAFGWLVPPNEPDDEVRLSS